MSNAAIHRIAIERVRPNVPARPDGNSETRYRVLHDGRELGVWRVPECSAARVLIERGLASRGDTLEIWRRQAVFDWKRWLVC